MLVFSRSVRPLYSVRFARLMSAGASEMKCLKLEVKDGVALVRMNDPDSKVNALSVQVIADFEKAIKRIETDDSIKAAVLISDKKDCFIAGADISMLGACKSAEDGETISKNGHALFKRIEKGKPFVAAIHGSCLGGGLETALACRYRIATQSSKTQLGLPEVMLGLLPGGGGTQRLPRLVGLQKALDLCLTGKQIKSDKAKKMGLVDGIADPFALENAAIQAAKDLAAGTLKVSRRSKGIVDKLLENNPVGRSVVFNQATKMVMKNTKGKYPAPLAILECLKAGASSEAAGYATEAKLFGRLTQTHEADALMGLFHGQTATKKHKFGKPDHDINTIAVIGAGLMGAGIAQVTAKSKTVLLKDREVANVSRGIAYVSKNLDDRLKKKKMTQFEHNAWISNIIPLTDADDAWKRHFARADMVIEAVFEDVALKHRIIRELEPVLPAHCVFASNTSAIPIAKLAEAATRPERVIGMHYFSPVEKMPLLEIIPHAGTSSATSAAAVEMGVKQGKTTIVVKDVPGFYVNRCLGPFLVETCSVIQDGADAIALDNALRDFGLPVGPVTLADEVGVDVANHVQKFLTDCGELGVRMTGGDTSMMSKMVAAGLLGRKSGAGFFKYSQDKKNAKGPRVVNPDALKVVSEYLRPGAIKPSMEDMQMRLISRFVNEAVLCLQDGIISCPSDGDIGAVFGMGFSPFHGGPFRWVDYIGADKLVAKMEDYAAKQGSHFKPCDLLYEHAKTGKKFHPSKK